LSNCPTCGAPATQDAAFCAHCGSTLPYRSVAAGEAVAPVEPAASETVQDDPYRQWSGTHWQTWDGTHWQTWDGTRWLTWIGGEWAPAQEQPTEQLAQPVDQVEAQPAVMSGDAEPGHQIPPTPPTSINAPASHAAGMGSSMGRSNLAWRSHPKLALVVVLTLVALVGGGVYLAHRSPTSHPPSLSKAHQAAERFVASVLKRQLDDQMAHSDTDSPEDLGAITYETCNADELQYPDVQDPLNAALTSDGEGDIDQDEIIVSDLTITGPATKYGHGRALVPFTVHETLSPQDNTNGLQASEMIRGGSFELKVEDGRWIITGRKGVSVC
jgi:hypothetical protein